METTPQDETRFWISHAFKCFIPLQFSYSLCALYMILWDHFNAPLVIPALVMLISKLIMIPYSISVMRKKKSETFYLYGLCFDILFYIFLIPATFNKFSLIYAGIPLYCWNLISAFLDYKNDSNFSLMCYFLFTIMNWSRSLLLICFDLRRFGVIEWDWVYIFWPFWLTSLLSVCIALFYLLGFLFKGCNNVKVSSVIWVLTSLVLYPVSISLLILSLSQKLSGEESFVTEAYLAYFIFVEVYLIAILFFRSFIEDYIIFCFSNLPEEKTGHSIKRIFKTVKATMTLSKISSTLYTSRKDKKLARTDSESSVKDCMICCIAPCDSVFMPCGHAGVCNTCALKLLETTKICHICRNKIAKVIQLVQDNNKVVLITEVENE